MSSNKKKKVEICFLIDGKYFVEADDYAPSVTPTVLGMHFLINRSAKSKAQELTDFLEAIKSNEKKYDTVRDVFEEIQNGFFQGRVLRGYFDFDFHSRQFNHNYYLSLPILEIMDDKLGIVSKMKCPVCGSLVNYHESDAIIYGRQYSKYGRYVCSQFPKCDTHVGCHPDKTPLGVLKNKEGRDMAKKCHAIFDSFWKEQGLNRGECYEFLADKLGISVYACHFGMMSNVELANTLTFLNNNRKTFAEQVNSSPLFEERNHALREWEEEQRICQRRRG